MPNAISRRDLIVGSVTYGSSLWLLLNLPRPRAVRAAEESSKPLVLREDEWKTLEAITARIIPTDAEPGAREAGVTNFIDKALAHEDAAMAPLYGVGLAGVDAVARRGFEQPFVALDEKQQDAVLAALETGKADGWPERAVVASSVFFEAVRAHTIIGFLADPKYGGNRDYAGWKVTGYPGGGHHMGGYSPSQMMAKEKITTAWGKDV
jgi:gluconate 2-dehydrogenase gamma chain